MHESRPAHSSGRRHTSGLPFDRPGAFWRGNLHTHTTESDGALTPRQAARHYQEHGYDFLAVTDHFRPEYDFPVTDTRALRGLGFTTLIGAELHAPRTEAGPSWHIVTVGLPLGFAPPHPGEDGPHWPAGPGRPVPSSAWPTPPPRCSPSMTPRAWTPARRRGLQRPRRARAPGGQLAPD